LPFIANIDVDGKGEAPEVELIKSSPDRRVQHIRIQGSPVEALSAMSDYEQKQKKKRKPPKPLIITRIE
jgi:hypothetical protein